MPNHDKSIPLATLQSCQHALKHHAKALQSRLDSLLASGEAKEAHFAVDTLLKLNHCTRHLDNAYESLTGDKAYPVYVTTSWFLSECRTLLTKTQDEAMLFVTGFQCGALRSLDRFLQLKYSEQSQVFVAATDPSVRTVLAELNDNGQKLLAWFHSHPGRGKASTFPSHVDLGHQRDLEAGGYPVIGGIFTRDGYVGFFSHNTDFEIEVLGSNVEQMDEETFRLAGS